MPDLDPIYITGHQHPDTDSIVSAIAYAFFKRCQGKKAIACRLGDVNNESRYLLNRFHYEEPMLLKDARKTLGEIELDSPISITPETTVLECVRRMHAEERFSYAVVDEKGKVTGIVSSTNLANIGLGDTAAEIELLKHTPVFDIAESINGTIIYDDKDIHINGKTSIIAMSQAGTANYDVQDRIVIIGDDAKGQMDLIEKGAGMLIVVWAKMIDADVLISAKQHHVPIIISGHGVMNTSRYLFLSPPVRLIMQTKPVCFRESDLVEEAGKKMLKTRYRSYPVVDANGVLKGYVSRAHIMDYKNKRIILVDHNEFSQSVPAIEKAQILEVVDHHRINDFATSQPVSFRNEIVGSTATIIATMFRENQILMPKELAGLLLGAILSDTLIFQSPTTTQKDRDTANILAALADLDIDTFGKEMFAAGAAGDNRSIHDMIVSDIKYYDINGVHTMISQVIVYSAKEMNKRRKEIQTDIDTLAAKKELGLLCVAFTSVIEDGSVFYAGGEKADKVLEAFPGLHELQPGILSRKKQILPKITEAVSD
ncbi:MAG: putative manganese-dependent inorganic diphosphatase [Bulleidia sp.]|nr:putative manganese-dependent inorganic diphosphatase [Bulleidia sp.]